MDYSALPPPGLEDDGAGENRYRWTVRDEFSEEAYKRLVSGRRDASVELDSG